MAKGEPNVTPFSTPAWIFTASFSSRGVVRLDWPGLLLESWPWMSASVKAIPGGTPSTIHPTDAQCDSPYVVTLKWCPKVDMMGCLGECLYAISASFSLNLTKDLPQQRLIAVILLAKQYFLYIGRKMLPILTPLESITCANFFDFEASSSLQAIFLYLEQACNLEHTGELFQSQAASLWYCDQLTCRSTCLQVIIFTTFRPPRELSSKLHPLPLPKTMQNALPLAKFQSQSATMIFSMLLYVPCFLRTTVSKSTKLYTIFDTMRALA
jgi:hypothetical protein